jgi:hypothetical protein
MSSPRQVGHRVRDAIAVFEQNKGKIVFSEEKDKKLYSKDRPVRRLPKDNIYLQDDLKNRRNTGALSPSPPPGKDVHSKRIIYSFVPRYQLDCKESSTPNSPTSGSGRHSSSAGSASTFGCVSSRCCLCTTCVCRVLLSLAVRGLAVLARSVTVMSANGCTCVQ